MQSIRSAEASDLALLEPLAQQFYASSRFLRGFDRERFEAFWATLIETGMGVVYLLMEGDRAAGAIGGVAYSEPYSGELVASEFFWFVDPAERGGGLRLYRAFEQWARGQGCSRIRMVHLNDSMPEKLARVYSHLGFEAIEVHFEKGV